MTAKRSFHYGDVDGKFERAMRHGGLTAEARKRARRRAAAARAKELAERRSRDRIAAYRLQEEVVEAALTEFSEAMRKEREQAAREAESRFLDIARQREIPATVISILREVASLYRVPVDLLVERRCTQRKVTTARHAAAYTIRALNVGRSFPRIARWFGQDHTTILSAVRAHARKHDLPELTKLGPRIKRKKIANDNGA